MFQRLTPMVKNLLIITVVVYFIPQLLGMKNVNQILGLWHVESPRFMPYQLFSYMFAHGGFMHIFFNMMGLVFLGPLLEQHWGPKRFLTFYLITGIGAGLFYEGVKYTQTIPMKNKIEAYSTNPNPDEFAIYISKHAPQYYSSVSDFINYYNEHEQEEEAKERSISILKTIYAQKVNVPMVGASGAIYGILMAFGMLFPNTQLMLLFPPIPIKAKYLVIILGAIAVYSEFDHKSGDNVAHLAHLGGMIFAFIMIKIWARKRNNFY